MGPFFQEDTLLVAKGDVAVFELGDPQKGSVGVEPRERGDKEKKRCKKKERCTKRMKRTKRTRLVFKTRLEQDRRRMIRTMIQMRGDGL